MNIELQCCALAVLAILFYISVSERSLALTSRRLYFRAFVSCVVSLLLDILSIVAIHEATYAGFSPLATEAVCKAYIIALVLQAYEGFLYAAGEFFDEGSHRRARQAFRLLFVAGCVGMALLPIGYYMDGRVVYSFGPADLVAYAVSFALIVSSLVVAFGGTKRSSRRRRRCILVWQGSWLLAAGVQFFNPELLLTGFASAFGMVLVYAELENPHEGIDRLTGQFSANALLSYVDDLYRHGRGFSALHVRVEYRIKSVDPNTEKDVMLRVSKFLADDRSGYVFRQADDELMVIYFDEHDMRRGLARVMDRVDEVGDLPARLYYTLVPDARIMRSADELMRFDHYVEKRSQGQECIEVDRTAVDEMRAYLDVHNLVSLALAEGRVEVFFQPIYNVARGRFTSAEALVRIRERDGSLVPPASFIPAAEENGLIVPLGLEIFRQVCELLSTGRAQELGLEYVEVNLSVAQFDDENPAKFVQAMMDEYGIDPALINLEITETASIGARKAVLANMERLIARGVRFSLDDFGTGRSNLDYFVEMPVNIIKFDYSFTQGYFRSEKARRVVESVTDLMHRMDLPVVAEGVETEGQLAAMCDLGISYIQGFYFSRPVPCDEFLAFLAERNGVAA